MFYKNIQFKERAEYIYEASLINTMRLNLFNLGDYERMVESDLDVVYNSMAEKNYDTSEKNIEDILKKEEKKLLDTVVSYSKGNRDLEEYFLIPYDFFNLKAIHKGWLKEEEFENLKLYPFGILDKEKLMKFYQGDEIGVIHPDLAESINDFEEDIEDRTPFEVDFLWDKYLNRFYLNKCKKLDNDFMLKIHSLQIDLANMLNLFRLKSFDKDYKVYEHIFFHEGQLSLYVLSDLYKEEMDVIIGKLHFLDYYEALKMGVEDYRKTSSLSIMEKELDKFFFNYLNQVANKIFGYEIIIAFFWQKMNEINNLRLLLVAKENSIEKNWILNKMRG